MNYIEKISVHFNEHLQIISALHASYINSIQSTGFQIAGSLKEGGALFWCGNGGSAADSQHLAAELVGRFKKDRKALRSIALLGKDGGQAKALADLAIVIPSDSTARIQEAHILIGHILCDLIEQELGLA